MLMTNDDSECNAKDPIKLKKNIASYTAVEIKAELKRHGFQQNGNKEEVVERLQTHYEYHKHNNDTIMTLNNIIYSHLFL